MKINKKKVFLVVAFILYAVVISLATGYITKKYIIKTKTELINYKIIDIVSYKIQDNKEIITYFAKINEHDYAMIDSKLSDNVFYIHLENCSYCKKHNYKAYNGFCFTIKDGNTTDFMDKLDEMKAKVAAKK